MNVIGNENDAFTALWEADNFGYGGPHFLGNGGNRKAFLINDVVYKVDHVYHWSSNCAEYAWWTQVLSSVVIPAGIRIEFVPVDQYEFRIDDKTYFVNAMPFIKGEPLNAGLPYAEDSFLSSLGLMDMYCDNVLHSNGTYYVVDGEM